MPFVAAESLFPAFCEPLLQLCSKISGIHPRLSGYHQNFCFGISRASDHLHPTSLPCQRKTAVREKARLPCAFSGHHLVFKKQRLSTSRCKIHALTKKITSNSCISAISPINPGQFSGQLLFKCQDVHAFCTFTCLLGFDPPKRPSSVRSSRLTSSSFPSPRMASGWRPGGKTLVSWHHMASTSSNHIKSPYKIHIKSYQIPI